MTSGRDWCLSASGLGKAFRKYRGLGHRVASWVGLATTPTAEHWALRDLSFELHRGEAIGLIGANGAGKSTALKLLTGTLRPTTGTVAVRGTLAAILELGLGFNPELTGRMNVLQAGGLMGFSRDQLLGAMPELEAFAEIGDAFDAPVRTYSSGMQARLAFAVATAFRPDILIVDEALSVGDAYFQHKSFDRIRQFLDAGSALLIVSHDKAAIQSLCSRVLLLESGRLVQDGEPEAVLDYYNARVAQQEAAAIRTRKLDSGRTQTISGTGEATVEHLELHDEHGQPLEIVKVGQRVTLLIDVRVHQPVAQLVLGYGLRDRLGQVIYGTNTYHTGQVLKDVAPGLYRFALSFDARLGVGSYAVQTALVDGPTHLGRNYEWRDLAMVFEVRNVNHAAFAGCAWIEPEIALEKLA